MRILMRLMSIFFCAKPSFVDKKLDEKINKFGELSTEEVQEITYNAVPISTKSHKVRNENIQRYVSLKSWTISNINIEILRNDEDYVTRTIFVLCYWIACLSWWHQISKPIEEMSKEKLSVLFKCFCTSARKKHGKLSVYKSSSMKSIWGKPPSIVSFTRK